MPWSTALRIRCVSGSRMLSTRLRSSSVSAPSTTNCTSLPHARARSRTVRGNLLKTCSIGCIRVLTAASCRAFVTALTRWATACTAGSSESMLRSWLRASTSSPTRSRIEARSPTSTRIVDSVAVGTVAAAGVSAGGAALGGAAGTEAAGGGSSPSGVVTAGGSVTAAAGLDPGEGGVAGASSDATAASDRESSR